VDRNIDLTWLNEGIFSRYTEHPYHSRDH